LLLAAAGTAAQASSLDPAETAIPLPDAIRFALKDQALRRNELQRRHDAAI